MVLETLNSDRINIKGLTLNEPELNKNYAFDPNRDITDEKWGWAVDTVNNLRQRLEVPDAWFSFVPLASNMKILFPERESQLNLTDQVWSTLQIRLEEFRKDFSFMRVDNELDKKLKILFPKQFTQLGLTDEYWSKQEELSDLLKNFGNWPKLYYLASTIKIAFPDKASALNLDEKVWIESRDYCQSYRGGGIHLLPLFLKDAAILRILFPEKISELNIDENLWKDAKTALKRQSNLNNPSDFMELAANMKILAAEKVEITDEGQIEIIMPKSTKLFIQPTPNIPEVRRF